METYVIKQYNRRWINLFLFVIYAINNGIHCTQYSVINDSISEYYNVPHVYVEWTAGLYTVSYILFFVPGLYALERIKLRYVMIFASLLTTIGAWIKVFSVQPDRFIFAYIAQSLISVSYTFVFGGSARLIATWFGVHESSRASALSLLGDQFGSGVGFIMPAMLVQKSSDLSIWENSLKRMHVGNAAISTLFLALIILLFKDKPKHPPSIAQAMKVETKSEAFSQSLKKMVKNRAFLMLLFWYSLLTGMLGVLAGVLGEIVTMNFQDSYDDAGKIGFILRAMGMLSAPMFGYFMDKTHKFKLVGLILSTGTFICYLIFTLALKSNNIQYVYITAVFLGIFVASAYVSGIQIGIEILYPISEDKCASVMIFIAQLFAFFFLATYGVVLRNCGDITANSVVCSLTFAGSLVCFLGPVHLNRQKAEQGEKANVEECQHIANPQIEKH